MAPVIRKVISRKPRVDVPAGVVVVADGASDKDCDQPASLAELAAALGVTMYVSTKVRTAAGLEHIAARPADILTEGEIYLICEEAVTVTDTVHVRYATGTGTQLGAVRNDVDSTTCGPVSWLQFDETTSGPGIVRCRISKP